MATIYRFVIEQKTTGGSGSGRKTRSGTGKGAAKKGKTVSLFGGDKGGVEHNRKMRAINPLLNKATGGAWEKGMRVGRAAMGLVKVDAETGKFAGLSGSAIAIIVAFVVQTLLKYQNHQRQLATKQNLQNFKQMENGIGAINTQYEISVNAWTGARTFNENK